jgi:branched-chain amino acid transport system substrate-binding protein
VNASTSRKRTTPDSPAALAPAGIPVTVRSALPAPLAATSAALLLLLPALSGLTSFASPASHEPEPYRNLRADHLEYVGPSDDLTNLSEIRIGWFGPSDTTNSIGADMWWAASFAVDEANRAGGFNGLPFRLLPRWSVDPWGTGVSQLTRMVYDDQPVALLGGVDSATTHLAEQVVAKANLPLVSPVATDKSVTLAGVPWMFSCAPSDAAIARALVTGVLARLASLPAGADGLAVLSGTDHESRMTAREVLKELSRNHRLPNFQFEVPPGAQAITEQMRALAESRPAVVLLVARADDAARLALAVGERVPGAAIFGSHTLGRTLFLDLAGEKASGAIFPLLFAQSSDAATTNRFINRFVAEHHRPPDYTGVLTYDATRLLIAAVLQAGPNRARIRTALHQLSPWHGLSGEIRFDGTGQNSRSGISLGTVQQGVITPLLSSETPVTAPNDLDRRIVNVGNGVNSLIVPGQIRDSSRRVVQPASH